MSSESSLGTHLRRCRERSGLSMEAVSTGSRIVLRLVAALEADRQDLLPAPVYVRGFIRAYCDEVGADAEEALRLYDAQAMPAPPAAPPASSPPAWARPSGRRWGRLAGGSLLVAALGVAAMLLLERREPDAVAGRGASGTESASGSTTPGSRTVATVPPQPLTSAATAAPASGPPAPVERVLLVRAIDTTWVGVEPDGGPPAVTTLSPGAVREWRSTARFHITVGNAGGVELELDGQPLPALGAPGQIVRDASVPGEPRP